MDQVKCDGFEIPLESNLFNTLEYFALDLFIAGLVHVLTSKLVGLYNCYSVTRVHPAHYLNDKVRAPIFDLGILCTRRRVFYSVVAFRAVSWTLILITAIFIEGQTRPTLSTSEANVVVRGSFSVFDDTVEKLQQQFMRKSCSKQVRERDIFYYGEIRDGECELDRFLLREPVIEFGLQPKKKRITTRGCTKPIEETFATHRTYDCPGLTLQEARSKVYCLHNITHKQYSCAREGLAPYLPCEQVGDYEKILSWPFNSNQTLRCHLNDQQTETVRCKLQSTWKIPYMICDNAVIACVMYIGDALRCEGAVVIDGVTHLCLNLTASNMTNYEAKCRMARNAEWNFTDWVSYFGDEIIDNIDDVYHTAYGSGLIRRTVEVRRGEQDITCVRYAWVVILVIKIVMVLVLLITCAVFRWWFGLFLVGNDEPRIKSLLAFTYARRNKYATANSDSKKSNGEEIFVTILNGEPCLVPPQGTNIET